MDCALLLQTLTSCRRFTNLVLRKALRAEILFQKLVLNKKSSLLQVTGSVMLLTRLLQFFGEQVLQHLSQLPDAHANKPPCTELLEDDSELDAQQEEDMEADAEGKEPEFDFAHLEYEFQQEGEVVAFKYFLLYTFLH